MRGISQARNSEPSVAVVVDCRATALKPTRVMPGFYFLACLSAEA